MADTDTAAALFEEGNGLYHGARALEEMAMARHAATAAARSLHSDMAQYHEAMSESAASIKADDANAVKALGACLLVDPETNTGG